MRGFQSQQIFQCFQEETKQIIYFPSPIINIQQYTCIHVKHILISLALDGTWKLRMNLICYPRKTNARGQNM